MIVTGSWDLPEFKNNVLKPNIGSLAELLLMTGCLPGRLTAGTLYKISRYEAVFTYHKYLG